MHELMFNAIKYESQIIAMLIIWTVYGEEEECGGQEEEVRKDQGRVKEGEEEEAVGGEEEGGGGVEGRGGWSRIDGGDQVGAGSKLAHITPQFTQGNVTRTENITDLAVNGNGFFSIDSPKGKAFTRDGSFHFDKDGSLINGDGYKVLGFQAADDGKISEKVGVDSHIRAD